MLLQIPGVLAAQELQQVHTILAQARFVDGKLSAGMQAQRVKNNQEVARDDQHLQILARRDVDHPRDLLPNQLGGASRTGGMGHIDSAIREITLGEDH